jgi:carbon monoxide dehydrogenase subunit G
MLQFSGEHNFNRPPAEVWAKLRDLPFLLNCIPDVEPGAQVQQDRTQFTIRPGFSFVRGKLDATMHVAEAVESEKLRFAVVSKGVGSSSEVQTDLHLAPKGEGTAVKWTAEIKQLGGLLKAVPRGLIQAAAQKVIADVWANIATKLESER